jgi:hypothetical protein
MPLFLECIFTLKVPYEHICGCFKIQNFTSSCLMLNSAKAVARVLGR